MTEWLKKNNLKCVIICGGMGTRLFPLTVNAQKTMLSVKQKPLLNIAIDFWKQFTNDFIFVTGFKSEEIKSFVKNLPINSTIIEDTELKGIAHAIGLAENHIDDRFIVILGDCLVSGEIIIPKQMEQGIGIYKTNNNEDIYRAYSVKINTDNFIDFVEEKPKEIINNLCGAGFYFFEKKVFDFIKKTPKSSKTGKAEITDVIKTMINSGEKVSPILINGNYLNVTYPLDLEKAEKLFLGQNKDSHNP